MKKLAVLLVLVLLGVTRAISDSPDPTSEFTFARVQFTMDFRASEDREAPWHHDYPYSEDFFLGMLQEVTSVRTSQESYKIVRFDDEDLFEFPFLYVSEPGFMALRSSEIEGLREYLNRGGFVMFDDFRGRDLDRLRSQMKLVFPERDMAPLTIAHPIFHSFYDLETLEMEPPYDPRQGRGYQGRFDIQPSVEFWGMSDDKGRLIMIANHNNDFGEYWEWMDRGDRPLAGSSRSVRLGINYLIYAMSH